MIRPLSTSTPGPQAPRFQSTPEDEKLLVALAERDLIHLGRGRDSDDYGPAMTAFEARQRLERGEPVVLEHPNVGRFEKSRFPEKRGRWYRGRSVDPDVEKAAWNFFRTEKFHGEGTPVEGYGELHRWAEANGFASGGALTPEESRASAVLQKYEGGVHGNWTVVYSEDDFHYGYWFTAKGERSDSRPGLYDPQHEKGGFLGLGAKDDRLTPYEAMRLLEDGRPVRIVVREGREATVTSFAELEAFDRLG